VITTAQNGASELLTDGREGFVLTNPDAQGELIAALDRMSDDRTRPTMSDHAARLGRAQTFETHVARLTAIFEEVAAAKRRAPNSGRRGLQPAVPHFHRSHKALRS
jgi:UDP-glucose:(heptosyl)LPS alpha-1,3-glucosyltransferase